jgi:broad specificity phosphatase PhoE
LRPVTRLVLVRHGETVWHAENRYAGSSDVALTDRGRAQAARLAAWVPSAGLTGLWVSPLSRARETAAAAGAAAGLVPVVDERLRELHFGEGEGCTRAEMAARWPDRLAAFEADPVAAHLPDGEDPRAAATRMVACLDEIAEGDPDGRVLVIAHSTVIRLALCTLLGIPLADYRRVFPKLVNVALTELVPGRPAALLQLNSPVPTAP